MTFQVGDVVRCIESKYKYRSDVPILVLGDLYTILSVMEEDGEEFVQVSCGISSNFFARRFEFVNSGEAQEKLIIRKIKLMEQRFKTSQENKRDYNLAA
jgi:hypothetical protein